MKYFVMMNNKTEKIIKRAKKVHGDLYNYSKMKATTLKEKTIVICPKHGEFETTMDSHINKKSGCPSCHKVKKYTNDEWIYKVDEIHHHKYDYSKTLYTKAKEKVCVICHEKDEFGYEHGEFYVRAGNHMAGIGCPKCGGKYNMTSEEYFRKANKKHQNKYDYSDSTFNGTKNKIKIICHEVDFNGHEHGVFEQNAASHLYGCGCPKCNGGVHQTKDEFVSKSIGIHGNFYDYSKVEYVTAKTKVEIVCPIHGSFMQTPDQHVRGQGCPKCKSSIMETTVLSMLVKNKIYHEYQSGIIDLGNQSVDFYIPSIKTIIECQGEQHFIPTRFSKSISYHDAHNELKRRITLDKEKYDKSIAMGFNIVYYIDKKTFSRKNIKTETNFYKNKNVFYNIDNLEQFLVNEINSVHDHSLRVSDGFYQELCDNISGGYIENGVFIYKKYGVFLQKLEYIEKRKLYNKQRNFNKNGRSLIVVYEDEYRDNKDLVIEKIKHIMGLDYKGKAKIYGRKCFVSEIEWKDAKVFLDKNHIQKSVQSTVYLGAFYNNKLIAVMSFLNEGDDLWNLTRFAGDNRYILCGVSGKLFNFFIQKYQYKLIKTFADKRWTTNSNNNMYTKIGFVLDKKIEPSYYYLDKTENEKKRLHKFRFRRDTLIKKYGINKKLTELEMTKELGYERIWDCGLFKYVWRKNQD